MTTMRQRRKAHHRRPNLFPLPMPAAPVGRRLTAEGEALLAWFERDMADRGCTCFISPPCGFCTHEGNPINLEETDDVWEPDT